MKKTLITFLAFIIANIALAESSPEGAWRTIDDETGKAKSLVSIWIEQNELKGRVDRILNPTEPNLLCVDCKGELKNKPIEGMTFLWGLKQDEDEWTGGTILDPSNGKEYKAKIKMIDDGNKLEVRGFIGFSLIGRTQVWERIK